MPTLSSGSSVTLTLGAFESLSMISGVAGQSSIAFTSLAPNVHPDVSVTKAQSKTYGPFGVPMTVVISCSDGSVTYTQNRSQSDPVWSDSTGTAFETPSLTADDTNAATANTAALQTALSRGGVVWINKPGVVWINGRLTVYDDTEIYIGAETELKLADSARTGMFINSQYSATENAVSAMTASGNIATVSSTTTPTVGQYVAIKGATTKGYCGVWPVVSVTAGVSFTVRLVGVPATTTAAGTIVWCAVNRNISIRGPGRINHNQRGQGVAIDGTDATHTILMRHVDQVRIGHGGLQMVDARKWSIFLACVGSCDLTGHFDNTDPGTPSLSSACIDIQGPCVSAKVHDCTGVSADDCLVFTMGDIAYINKSRGDFYNLDIANINMTTAKLLVRVSGNSPYVFHNIEMRNIKGTADTAGIGIVDFGVDLTQTSFDRCVIDGVEIDTLTADPVISVGNSVAANSGTLIVRNLRQKISNSIGVSVNGSITLKKLAVHDVIADSANANPVVSVSATVTRADFARWKVEGGTNCYAAYCTGTINRLSMRDMEVSGSGMRAFGQEGTVGDVYLDGIHQLSGYCMVEQGGAASASARYYASRCRIVSTTSVFRFTKAVQLLTNSIYANSLSGEFIQSSGGVCSWGGEFYAPGVTESTLTGGATISKLTVQVA